MPWRGPAYPGEVPSLGWMALEWISEFLVVPDGPLRGEPLVLTDEQASIVLRFYALNEQGQRLYRRALVSRSKGWGKSPLLAALCAFEFAGPARFDGWDAGGDPVGCVWPTPWVQIAALSEDQTDNTYALVIEMLTEGTAADEFGLDVGLTRSFDGRGGRIEPVTSSAGSREGQRVTFACLDETHLWVPRNGGPRLAATIRRNAAKMGGATFETTNAYRPGSESVAQATAEAAARDAEGLLYDHREPKVKVSLRNRTELRRALRYVYGDACGWVDVDRIVAEIEDPATDPDDARQFYLNQIWEGADTAFDAARHRLLARPDESIETGRLVVLGFDGARYDDATGIVATDVETGFQQTVGVWEKPDGVDVDEWEVDEAEVDEAIAAAFDRWEVWRAYCDPPYWESTVSRWAGRWGEKRIVAWYTHRRRQMAYACRAYAEAIRSDAAPHDGHDGFMRHVRNARRRELQMRDEEGKPLWLIQKERPRSPLKIDAASAGVLSWQARLDAVAKGAKKRRRRAGGF